MPTKRYSTEQIVSKLRQAEVELGRGLRVPQMCKKLGISEQTYYRWRKEYGGLRLDQARRLKELERVTLGWRPLPKDDHPVVGFVHRQSDVYLAVMHSGVTLAPLIGRLAAQEILDDVRVELLEPYRLERFGG